MAISDKVIFSDFLRYNVRCNKGFDHGPGIMVWMYPPVHRILGWITRPSTLSLSRHVWRLNQIKGISNTDIYVKGDPAISDQATIERFPTLINAKILNKEGNKIASIVDLVFQTKSGNILYYLVARSNPKIPGSSRWSLKLNLIKDQQPGMILTDLSSLDDLPIVKSSFRQEFIQKSKDWRTQILDFTDKASNKLEGWLEESPWDEDSNYSKIDQRSDSHSSDKWIDDFDDIESNIETIKEFEYSDQASNLNKKDHDPWI